MMKWLTHEWGLKLVSLALAVGLWYYAVGEESVQVTKMIPLEIRLKSEKMSILKASAKMVELTFEAPRSLISNLMSDELRAVHEIGDDIKTAVDYSFRVESRELNLASPAIRVVKINPEIVHVTIDEMIVQKLEIKPQFVGDPAIGYRVSDQEIQLNPNAILVEGPKGQLEKHDNVLTEKIHLVGRIRPFRNTVRVELPPNVKALSETLIDAYIPIKEEVGEKLLENLKVRVMKNSEMQGKVIVKPNEVSVSVKGPKRLLDKLSGETVLAYVDITNYDQGNHLIPLALVLPEDVVLTDNPPMIAAEIKK